jgi:hypothetical protein
MDDVFNTDSDSKANRTESVDLNSAGSDPNSSDYLKIEISDALNEKDKVKFTIVTKVRINSHHKC